MEEGWDDVTKRKVRSGSGDQYVAMLAGHDLSDLIGFLAGFVQASGTQQRQFPACLGDLLSNLFCSRVLRPLAVGGAHSDMQQKSRHAADEG